MERNQPEWVQRFGAKLRAEHVPSLNDTLPTGIAAKLQALEEAELRLRLREREDKRPVNCHV